MKWLLLCCLCVTGCLELPAAPVVLIDLPPSRVENLAPVVPHAPQPGICPQITELMATQTADSISFRVRFSGPIAASHGDLWFAQIVVGRGDGLPGELYLRGSEEKEGRVPIRNAVGESFEVVGYCWQVALDAKTVQFVVARSALGTALTDEAFVMAQSAAADQCGDWSFMYTEAGNPRWQRVRRTIP